MRVLHIASEYPPLQVFGLGRAVCDLAVAQAAQGHEVHVVTNSIGGRDPEAVVDGVHVHRITFPPPPKPPDDTMAVQQFNISALQTAAGVARESEPDVVHVHDWLTALSGRMMTWLYPDARLVCTIHDTAHGKHFGELTMPQQYSAHLERWIGQEADAVICCSRYVANEMAGQYDTPSDRIAVIPCGVSERHFRVEGDLKAYRTLFAEPDERIIGYVGRLDREKGLPTLLEAFAAVHLARPEAKLVLVGKGVLQQQLSRRAVELEVAASVHFAGYLSGPALAGFYRSCDVLVVPSLYEPFGIVALEGMINRVPVVASDAGGLTEIIDHQRNGLQFSAGDAQALARELMRVLEAPDDARRVAQQGYEDAAGRFDWGGVAARTIEAYGVPERVAAAGGGR